MPTNVVMPQLGESVVEGVVVKWRVKEGDLVKADDPIAEVETDKATTEVPSPATGRVLRLLVKEGQTIGVGKAILEIEDGVAAAGAPGAAPTQGAAPPQAAALPTPSPDEGESAGSAPVQVPVSAPLVLKAPVKAQPATSTRPQARVDEARLSPVVRKMADEYQLDLSLIQGTGDGGRITKKDVQAFLARPQAAGGKAPLAPGSAPGSPGSAPRTAPAAGDQVIPFTRRRRVIAERMSLSRRTIPEVTTFSEVDMSRIAQVRARYKAQAGKTPGAPKLTYLPFICAAAVQALREYPIVNAQIVSSAGGAEDAYVLKADINLGVAVDTDEGLIVPVMKHADELSLLGLARATDALGEKGRTGKITPDEMAGGTFTISNPGLKGNLFGTPIINLPQVGCLRMGEVVKRAVVVERDGEDTLAIRPMMYLAFAYDHRIVDGVPGNAFLHRVTELLEAGDFPL